MKRTGSAIHPVLQLYLDSNQWKLATGDAWYSDGKKYRPLRSAFKSIGDGLKVVENVLVLGAGLGSAVYILDHAGIHPEYTLVEVDNVILEMAVDLLPTESLSRVDPVCMDAKLFVQNIAEHYQLVICDIFIGRAVPDFVSSAVFLGQCKKAVTPDGYFILNYIGQSKPAYQELCLQMQQFFPGYNLIEFGINKIFVCAMKANQNYKC